MYANYKFNNDYIDLYSCYLHHVIIINRRDTRRQQWRLKSKILELTTYAFRKRVRLLPRNCDDLQNGSLIPLIDNDSGH